MFNSKKNLEILRKAFDVIAREEAKSLPTPEECTHVTFSEEFEQKMQKLINKEKKPYYYLINTVGKRVACVIIVLLLALTSVTFGVKAIREAVIDFFVETFEKFSIVGFKDEDIPRNLDYIETYYTPTYIPDGYMLKKTEKFDDFINVEYVFGDKYIYYTQRIINENSFYLDTENSNTKFTTINGYKAYLSSNNNAKFLSWNDKDYAYTICLTGYIEESELIKIAKSIK